MGALIRVKVKGTELIRLEEICLSCNYNFASIIFIQEPRWSRSNNTWQYFFYKNTVLWLKYFQWCDNLVSKCLLKPNIALRHDAIFKKLHNSSLKKGNNQITSSLVEKPHIPTLRANWVLNPYFWSPSWWLVLNGSSEFCDFTDNESICDC